MARGGRGRSGRGRTEPGEDSRASGGSGGQKRRAGDAGGQKRRANADGGGQGRRGSGGSGGQGRRSGAGSGTQRRRTTRPAEQGIIPVLAGIARDLDGAVRRAPTRPAVRTQFQVVALLVREERARVKADGALTAAKREQELKRLDGVATLLARIAARDTSLLALLGEDARVSDAARAYKATVMRAAGLEPPDEPEPPAPVAPTPGADKRVVPQSVISRRLANPFLAPDYEAAATTWDWCGMSSRPNGTGTGRGAGSGMQAGAPGPACSKERNSGSSSSHPASRRARGAVRAAAAS